LGRMLTHYAYSFMLKMFWLSYIRVLAGAMSAEPGIDIGVVSWVVEGVSRRHSDISPLVLKGMLRITWTGCRNEATSARSRAVIFRIPEARLMVPFRVSVQPPRGPFATGSGLVVLRAPERCNPNQVIKRYLHNFSGLVEDSRRARVAGPHEAGAEEGRAV